MHAQITGKIQLPDEEVTLIVDGEYEKYSGSSPADEYVKMREIVTKKESN